MATFIFLLGLSTLTVTVSLQFTLQKIRPSLNGRITQRLIVICHLFRSKLQIGLLQLFHVPSNSQLADVLTKTLYPNPFQLDVFKL